MKLYQVLIKSAEEGLKKQNADGSMPPGHNGPYYHPETPVRNTGHWLITFLKAYKFSKDDRYLKASNKCIEYILSNRGNYNFHHRTFEGRDKCNGLIGPAWTIEALLVAAKELARKDLFDLASDIFLIHKFDKKLGLWYRREINGDILSVDGTFNHQLWFAAVGSMFDKEKYPKIHNQVKVFIEKLADNFDVYKNGLIWHFVAQNQFNFTGLKRFISKILNLTIKRKKNIHKAIGYHQFNLYAFALLKKQYPTLSFWGSEKFQRALKFIETEEYKKGLLDNKFGFEYNVAGIETAYVLSVFEKNSENKQKYWLEKQFNRNYDFEKKMLCKNSDDTETLSARLYEAIRLKDLDIELFDTKNSPFISVIVPVYNDKERIKTCVEKLLDQKYPEGKYEIIVVDNNSSDSTPDLVKKYPVKLLFEKNIQSSYAARNKGIHNAKGDLLAFLDSDCQPTKTWIENGVRSLLANNVDLVAGKVSFIFNDKNDPYEVYDSISNMQQQKKVSFRGEAATANLFCKKNIFKEIGLFPEDVKSGGDATWTGRASKKGFKLIYEKNAKVFHPTRSKEQLLKKQLRVGYGQIPIWIKNRDFSYLLIMVIKDFLPPIIIPKKKKFFNVKIISG